MPVYNVSIEWLEKAINSVEKQSYTNWELCIVDDASTNKKIQDYLLSKKSEKIKVVLLEKNAHISEASNAALKQAEGEFIALLDHDDELTEDALYEVVKLLNRDPKLDLIYSDEDKKLLDGRRIYPAFKGGWNPEMIFSFMYIGHLGVYRKEIVDLIGGFRKGFEGAQDYDLLLRFTERTNRIAHIPRILYHWRMIPGSTAVEVDSKGYAYDRGRLAVLQSLQRRNLPCIHVDEDPNIRGNYIPIFKVNNSSRIFLAVFFNGDNNDSLQKKIRKLEKTITYTNYQMVIFTSHESLAQNNSDVVLINDNNILQCVLSEAVKCRASLITILDLDLSPITEKWLEKMIPYANRHDIAGVCGQVVSENNKIVYSGGYYCFTGKNLSIMYADYGDEHDATGYLGRVRRIQNTSIWFDKSLMIKTELLAEYLKSESEEYSMRDFLFYVLYKGKFNIYHPFIKFISTNHYSSACTYIDAPFVEKWKGRIPKTDQFINPNITYRDGKITLND